MLYLSENILLVRLSADLTQDAFAAIFGITKDQVYTYEKKKAKPNDLLVEKIADFAGVTVEDLRKKKLKPGDVNIKDPGLEIKNPEKDLHGALVRIESIGKIILNSVAQLLAKESGQPVSAVISSLAKAVQDEIEVRKMESK